MTTTDDLVHDTLRYFESKRDEALRTGDGDAKRWTDFVVSISRGLFRERHGFKEWDDTWETLWTVETGLRNG
jgi:hypothetical protein